MRTNQTYFDPQRDASTDMKTITLQQGTSVKGKLVIKSTGQPLLISSDDQFSYVAIFKSDGQQANGAHPKPDGVFSTDNLEAGKYTARFTSFDDNLHKYVVKAPPAFEAKVGETVNVVIELEEGIPLKGKITGAKLDAIQDNQFAAVIASKPGSNAGQYATVGKILKDGSWTLYLPDAGEYTIKYYLPTTDGSSGEKTWKNVTIEAGKTPEEVVIEHKQ
jgi:hypothetical protein